MTSVSDLTIEHHRETLGVGESKPRISWKVKSRTANWVQKKYELEVKRDQGEAEVYTVESKESILVPWPSSALNSAETANVKVRVTGSNDVQTEWSAPLVIETGLLAPSDWTCEFVQSPVSEDKTKPIVPASFKKEFTTTKQVIKARLYITAHGIYDAELNGLPVGDHVLAPGWTSYHNELPYQTFDVTNHLKEGGNALGVYVGEGWYCGRLGWTNERHFWGNRLGVIAQLSITYSDGSTEKIVSDKDWKYTEGGPVTRSEIYDGEDFDSRKVDKNWSTFGSAGDWKSVTTSPTDAKILKAPDGPPIRRIEEIKPIEILKSPSGKTIVDFGQNLVGWLKVKVKGPAGHEINFIHTEVLDKGEAGVRPLRSAKAIDRLTLSGEEVIWEPRFTFHGFRYVEVTNWPTPSIEPGALTAVVVHTDMQRTGHFECSNALINKLHENVTWSMRDNFVGIPTDCPQRDERLGWTGDIQAFAPTATFLYDCSGMLKSWLRNLASETNENGVPPVVSPNILNFMMDPQAIWSDALVFVPWDIFQATGDTTILREQFQSMIEWMEKGVIRDETGLWLANDFQLGDWLDPAAPPDDPGLASTDNYLVADCFLIASTDLIVKIATAIDKPDIASSYTSQAENLRKAFANRYITPAGRLTSDSQTAFALAIQFNLIPTPEQQSVAVKRFVELIRKNSKFKIATGFAGTPVMGPALTKVGQTQLFYRMLYERKCPSWLYPVTMGATTIWERWDSMLPDGSINPGEMTSFNHYALGAVAHWMHSTIGGLKALESGWKRFNIKPIPGGDLKYATTSFESPYGVVKSSWSIEGEELKLRFTVPPNTEAEVELPGLEGKVYGSGVYEVGVKYVAPEWPIKAIYHKFMKPPEDEFA